MTLRPAAIFFLLTATTPLVGLADTIYLRTGGVREGTIESRNDSELRLRITTDGISGTVVIPMSQIARIVIQPLASPAPPPPLPAPLPSPLAAHAVPSADVPPDPVPKPTPAELEAFRSKGFLAELAASVAGHGPDDLARFPAAVQDLWTRAVQSDAAVNRAQTLDALRTLESAVHDLPDGPQRLNAVSRHERHEDFSLWMARAHWDATCTRYQTGQFDFSDVRDIERPALIGMLKEKTTPALEPLRAMFPSVDEKTGQLTPFKPAQLQGVTLANAVDIKDKAAYASAILLAQLKLEPDMPAIDRGALSTQLATVNRILTRARELEPAAKTAAKTAAIRAERDRLAAAEKARRDALAAQHHTVVLPPAPKKTK